MQSSYIGLSFDNKRSTMQAYPLLSKDCSNWKKLHTNSNISMFNQFTVVFFIYFLYGTINCQECQTFKQKVLT